MVNMDRSKYIDVEASNALAEQHKKEAKALDKMLEAQAERLGLPEQVEEGGERTAGEADKRTHVEKIMGFEKPMQELEQEGRMQLCPEGELDEQEYLRRLQEETSKSIWSFCNSTYDVSGNHMKRSVLNSTHTWDEREVEPVDKTHHRRRDEFTEYVKTKTRFAKLMKSIQNS